MLNKISSRPQRRLNKLSKETVNAKNSRIEVNEDDAAQRASALICASYESLTLESRQQLREQFTSTFPDATSPGDRTSHIAKWPSRDNLSRFASMGRKDRASKTTSALTLGHAPVEDPALSPTLSFHTARPTQSVMPETIDVEAAINLLQELRKKASPEELVALHRALLPVKETEPASADSYEHDYHLASEYRRQFASRRRSNMPPGLATRGGPEDDPLRRYSDIQRRPVPARALSASVTDVLDEMRFANRPQTPVDSSNGQAGVYRSGTLRITNGPASPVSSMHFSDTFELHDAKEVKIVHTTVTNLGLVKEVDMDGESSDESNTFEVSPQEGPQKSLDEVAHHANYSMLTIQKRIQPERTNTAMRHYNEFVASPYDRKVSAESQASSANDSVEQQYVTPKASMAEFPSPDDTPEMPSRLAPPLSPRPELVLHPDSGYGSESSNGQLAEAPKDVLRNPIKLKPVEDQRWLTALPNTADIETHSLYTFDQIVKSPSLLGARSHNADTLPPHSSQPSVARRQTLFSSLKLNRSPSGKIVDASIEPADSIETVEVEAEKKPEKKKKKSKKLKKATPHHIKQARKELKRLEEAALADDNARFSPMIDRSSNEDTLQQTSVENTFKVHAPSAYARIQAAGTAFTQQEVQRSRLVAHKNQEAETAVYDEGDNISIINFGAVARSLGASPYDVSTRQFSETIDYIEGSENNHRIQSPFEIGHGMSLRTQGMNEKTASEFARSKSRDYVEAEHATASAVPRPRGPRKPVLDKEMPPLPPLPGHIAEQVRDAEEQAPYHVEQKVLLDKNDTSQPRRFSIMDRPIDNVDWEPQARIWRERREALNAALQPRDASIHAGESEVHRTEPRIQITEHYEPAPAVTPPRQPLKVDTAKLVQAQAVLADARAAINQRVLSSISPVSEIARQSWNQPLSSVSDISTSTSPTPPPQLPRAARPPSRTALVDASSGRFPADYLHRLNTATPPQPSRSAPPLPSDRPMSISLSVPDTMARPNSAGRSLSTDIEHGSRPSSVGRPSSAVLDRYSGGFQYEWQRDVGVMGSAGTRTSMAEGGERSRPSKVAYGLDFSDIPLFVQQK